MYFFNPNLNKLLLSISVFLLFSFTLFSQTPDFKVQHVQDNIGRTGGINTSFTAVSSLNNAIELANNNRKTHAGSSTNSGNLEGDDMAGARQLTNVNTLTYYRESGSNNRDMRFNTSIWEYIGPIGGGNELIVRGRYAVNLNGSTNNVTQALTGITNAANCIPFITGIMNDASEDSADSGTAIAYLENATTLRVQKGSDSKNVTVYITVVEFTGTNWSVLHGGSSNTGSDSGTITLKDGSNGTGTTTSVGDWKDAVIFSHFRADNDDSGEDEAIADLWPVVDPGSNNQTVNWTFNSNHDSEGDNKHFVHVLVNTGLNVTRFQNTQNSSGETTIDIASAGLTDVNQALIVGSSTSSGNGTAYGRGWRNYYLKSTTQAAHWAHRRGNTMSHEIQIIDLSGLNTTYSGVEINIQGNGTTIPNGNTAISITDDTDFGGVEVTGAVSVSHTFTIQNLGNVNLTLDGGSPFVTISGAHIEDFTLTVNPTTPIVAGGSTIFTITYDPVTAGVHNAIISIANNDSDENPYTFMIQGQGEYCSSNGSTTYDTSVTYVSFNEISNADNETPKDNAYEDFTNISTNVYKNSTHNLTVNVNTDGNYTIYTKTWIDWNTDGDFDDAGEEYDMGTATNVVNGPTSNSPMAITVPANAVIGSTTMRVATKYASFPSSCDSGFDGEVEDYSINVIDYLIDFNGTNSDIDFGDNHDLTGSFSLEAWILQEASVTTGTILSKGNIDLSLKTGYHFSLKNNYPNLIWYGNSNNEVLNITSPHTISNDKWHHIAATFDGSTAKMYIDGIEVVSATPSAPIDNSHSFVIGSDKANSTTTPIEINFFDGAIQEVRIWNVALTESQIREMMNQHIEQNSSNVIGQSIPLDISGGLLWSNLLGYYPLDSNTTFDSSGYNIEGVPHNMYLYQKTTAPLPYETDGDGSWDSTNIWLNNTDIYLPNTIGVDATTSIDWNIVELTNNITSGNRNITILGLISDTEELTIADPNNPQDETNSGQELRVTHYLKLDGIIDLVGESQLIQDEGSILDNTSTGYIERDQQGEGNKYRYNYWCSPVIKTATALGTSHSIADVLRDGTNSTPGTIIYTSGYDGAISPMTLSTSWMYKFANSSNGYSDWIHIGSTGTLTPAEGFTMKGTGSPGSLNQNYVFVGKPNNGVINLAVSGGSEYLVGNPYPSAIDANQFIFDNSPSGTASIGNGGALYFWEHYGGDSHNLADYQAGYATYSLSGGVPASADPNVSNLGVAAKTPGRYIAVGQGFFVVGDTDGGNIQFNNSQRVFKTETLDDSVFMKGNGKKGNGLNEKVIDLRPKLRIGFDAPKINHRQLLLTIDENTTDAIDWGYEAEIFEIFKDDMYWMLDDKKYVIQATNTFDLDKEIPLGIQTKEGGVITIKVDQLENIDHSIEVYIKDNSTGETYDIKQQAFEINLEAGEYLNRFALTFQPRLKSIEEIKLFQGIKMYMNNNISELQIHKTVDTEIINISLYNYLGQIVNTWDTNLNERFLSIPINITTGVYIAQINTIHGKVIKKIIIE